MVSQPFARHSCVWCIKGYLPMVSAQVLLFLSSLIAVLDSKCSLLLTAPLPTDRPFAAFHLFSYISNSTSSPLTCDCEHIQRHAFLWPCMCCGACCRVCAPGTGPAVYLVGCLALRIRHDKMRFSACCEHLGCSVVQARRTDFSCARWTKICMRGVRILSLLQLVRYRRLTAAPRSRVLRPLSPAVPRP